MSTSGCRSSTAPQSAPVPVSTFTTPGGRPASVPISANSRLGQRRELRRLQHDGVAGRDRRQDLPRGHLQRVVPRRDGPDHADGFAPDRGGVVRRSTPRSPCPRDCGRRRRRMRRCRSCRARRTHWPVGSACPRCDSPAARSPRPVGQQPRERGQYRRTDRRGGARPLGVRVPGGLHGAVDVLGSGQGDLGDDLAAARVANDAGLSAQGVTGLAVDELAHRCLCTLRWSVVSSR